MFKGKSVRKCILLATGVAIFRCHCSDRLACMRCRGRENDSSPSSFSPMCYPW